MLTLAGAIAPSAGKVKREGDAGFVFQNPSLQIVGMTVQEELAFGPKILKWSESQIEAFVQAGLEWTELEPLACPLDLHPSKQRLLTIAANDVDSKIMIFDEPTIGLDSQEISKVMARVQEMLNRGVGVVLITHDENVAHLSHRVVIIDEGRVRYDGSPT
jgi:energy-coupling factor transporter ATP-binding protein EcfA2